MTNANWRRERKTGSNSMAGAALIVRSKLFSGHNRGRDDRCKLAMALHLHSAIGRGIPDSAAEPNAKSVGAAIVARRLRARLAMVASRPDWMDGSWAGLQTIPRPPSSAPANQS